MKFFKIVLQYRKEEPSISGRTLFMSSEQVPTITFAKEDINDVISKDWKIYSIEEIEVALFDQIEITKSEENLTNLIINKRTKIIVSNEAIRIRKYNQKMQEYEDY